MTSVLILAPLSSKVWNIKTICVCIKQGKKGLIRVDLCASGKCHFYSLTLLLATLQPTGFLDLLREDLLIHILRNCIIRVKYLIKRWEWILKTQMINLLFPRWRLVNLISLKSKMVKMGLITIAIKLRIIGLLWWMMSNMEIKKFNKV